MENESRPSQRELGGKERASGNVLSVKELLPWPERLHIAREIFIARHERLLQDPDYQPVDKEERENLAVLRSGGKIKSYRIALDAAARVCQDQQVCAFTLKDIARVYDELFIDWRDSPFVNYDEEEWEKE